MSLSMPPDSMAFDPQLIQGFHREFNEFVNMSSDELEEWLKEESSTTAGWIKGDDSGETIGHERYARKPHHFVSGSAESTI